MAIFSGLVTPIRAQSPLSDFWYEPIGTGTYAGVSLAGLRVSEDTAMQASAVWACVRVISEALATVPLLLYRRLSDGRRERATEHYLFRILHDQPNDYQTAFEFREMMTAHCLLTGNAYARLVSGRRGAADQLLPMHPNRMTIFAQNGIVYYRYQEPDGTSTVYLDDEILHLRGLSNGGSLSSRVGYNTDGRLGMSVLQYARESIGLALATEQYGTRFFAQGARPGGILRIPGKLSKEAKDRLRLEWQRAHGGLGKAHGTAVLEDGVEWQALGLTNEDAQFLQTRSFQIADIARWFRVPLHMIQDTEKVTSWGTGIEQLSLAFVTYTLLPWARRWEQAIARDLITRSDLYAEYLFDSLVRGDLKSRYDAYALARNWGWLSANDIRERENMDPIEEGGDSYLMPLNMTDATAPPVSVPVIPAPSDNSSEENAHYQMLVYGAAQRIVRRETAALSRAAQRCAADVTAWGMAVDQFYDEHVSYVTEALQIPQHEADRYARERRAMVLEDGASALQCGEMMALRRLIEIASRRDGHAHA